MGSFVQNGGVLGINFWNGKRQGQLLLLF